MGRVDPRFLIAGGFTLVTLPFLDAGLIERIGVRVEAVTQMLDLEINRQALMIAYLNDYWIMTWAAALVVPLVLFMRAARPGAAPPPPMAE